MQTFHTEVEISLTVNPIPMVKPFPLTRLEDGLGCVNYRGKAKSLADMEQGIIKAAWQQWVNET